MTKSLNSLIINNIYMKRKIIFLIFLCALILPIISSEIATLGGDDGFPKGSTVLLEQINPECSYMTLDSVSSQSNIFVIDENMSLNGNTFYYNFSQTSESGEYRVRTCCDDGNGTICEVYNFFINQTGSRDEQLYYVIFIVLATIIGIIFFILSFIYDNKLFIFSAIGFVAGGLMTLYFPFGNETTFITNAVSILLTGIGMLIMGVYVIKDWFDA